MPARTCVVRAERRSKALPAGSLSLLTVYVQLSGHTLCRNSFPDSLARFRNPCTLHVAMFHNLRIVS